MKNLANRESALSARHRELGSNLEDWNGMGTAWSYATDPEDEYAAVRENVGMFDMSPLRKFFISGKDAFVVVDHLVSRDMAKVDPGRSVYVSVLTDAGTMADDAVVYRISDDEWMIVHGTGDTWDLAKKSAIGTSTTIRFDDCLHDISVQGPKSLEVLNAVCKDDLSQLRYFDHLETEIFGKSTRISRTGYTGERGYELFVQDDDVLTIWDGLTSEGVLACSFGALDKLRIEAGLLFYGYDMTTENTPWEVGLGFTINREKLKFRGSSSLFDAEHDLKVENVCLEIDSLEVLEGGEQVLFGSEKVGQINSPCLLKRKKKSLALAHVEPAFSDEGTCLAIERNGQRIPASIVSFPVYDKSKSRTHAL